MITTIEIAPSDTLPDIYLVLRIQRGPERIAWIEPLRARKHLDFVAMHYADVISRHPLVPFNKLHTVR